MELVEKKKEGENSKMQVDLNKRPSYFFLFELQDFIVRSISASGAREGGQIWKRKGYDCLSVRTTWNNMKPEESISHPLLWAVGGGDWLLCSLLLRRIFQGKREKRQETTLLCHPFF